MRNREQWLRGNPVTVVEQFFDVDPLTGAKTPASPTVVVFTVEAPDGTETAYTWGVDANVTNPGDADGLFLLALDPPEPPGVYHWRATGAGALVAVDEGTFEILESFILAPESPRSPAYGPCQQWIDGDDVLYALNDDSLSAADADDFADAAGIGSTLMWDLSGRQFDGICERTVRPCSDCCGCFANSPAVGLGGPWTWGGTLGGLGGWWFNDCGDRCGCGNLSTVRLTGGVREILEVLVDGEVVDPGSYRVDEESELVATNGYRWPACQRLDLDSGPGTFFVRYRYGAEPPPLGRLAAAQIGAEIWKAANRGKCDLPSGATRIVRQGVTVERIATLAQVFKGGATGLRFVDMFLASTNPYGMRRPPAVFSPDLRRPREARMP